VSGSDSTLNCCLNRSFDDSFNNGKCVPQVMIGELLRELFDNPKRN
jgi:hypothetical protein